MDNKQILSDLKKGEKRTMEIEKPLPEKHPLTVYRGREIAFPLEIQEFFRLNGVVEVYADVIDKNTIVIRKKEALTDV